MDIQKIRDFWLEEDEEAIKVAYHLFEKGDYSYSLFFGHLAIEKILKAVYVVRKGKQAPYMHNLQKLAELADIKLIEQRQEQLIKLTAFNLRTRYPDQKRSFRKKCTEDFTRRELSEIEAVFHG
jgi:HEPN domain-containing protein